jgi:ribosomal protein S27E
MVRKKANKIPKIKGRSRQSKVTILNQKNYDKKCEWAVEYKKGFEWNHNPISRYRYMACKKCGQMQQVSNEATACTCWSCVQEMVEPPRETKSRVTTGRPFGWHFMKQFVDKDGKVYHKGIEQPKLKGTLEPTKVKKPKRIPARVKDRLKREAISSINKLKKELVKAKFKKDKKVIETELRKHRKVASGKFSKELVEQYGKN